MSHTDNLAFAYFVPHRGGVRGWAILKAMFVQVIWRYRVGLHPKNDGVSTSLASCYFSVVLTWSRS